MAIRNITGSDPRKATVAAALKDASGARSVSMVKHDTTHNTYVGHCFDRGGASYGFHAVNVDTLEPVGSWVTWKEYQAALHAPTMEERAAKAVKASDELEAALPPVVFVVSMTAFAQAGEDVKVRRVSVPAELTRGATQAQLAELVFKYGQNDVQPMDRPSVSVGDVIDLGGQLNLERYQLVADCGFRTLTRAQAFWYIEEASRVGHRGLWDLLHGLEA